MADPTDLSPHCDDKVLHAPGACQFCDEYPERQAARVRDGVNFTRGTDPALRPCPSTEARGLDRIEAWFGNRPFPRPCPSTKVRELDRIEAWFGNQPFPRTG